MLRAAEVQKLAERLSKAQEIVAAGAVHEISGLVGYYAVQSSTGDAMYLVHLHEDGTACCSCRDYQDRQSKIGEACKHVYSAELFAAAPKPSAEPKPTKRTKVEKTDAPQAEARPKVDPAAALARLQGDDTADPWATPAAA